MLQRLPEPFRSTAVFLLLVGLYLACGVYSTLLVPGPDALVLFWPASGVALAGVVRYGLRWSPFVPLGALLVHLLVDPVPNEFLVFSLASNFLGVLAGAWLVLRRLGRENQPLHFGLRMLAGGVLMAAVSAGIGVTGLVFSGLAEVSGLAATVSRWFLGDLLGVACVAPAMLLFLAKDHPDTPTPVPGTYAPEGERLAWNIALTGSFLLMAWGASLGGHYALGLIALPLGVLVWSAVRFTPLHTATAMLVTLLLVAGLVGLGLAGYPAPRAPMDGINLLVFLCLVAVLPIILSFAVHQHRVTASRLQQRATVDPLTGLANRNAFEEQVKAELADRSAPPMALVYLDLDHLKLVNDTASHMAGDALIQGVAGVLEASRHRDDLLARTGGDEFALLMRNCTPMVAEDRARSLLQAIEGYRSGWDGQVLSTTASAGLVAFLPGQGEYAQLFSQADAACFTAKELGGNRVCQASVDGSGLLDRTAAMRWAVRIRESLESESLVLVCQSIVPLRGAVDPCAHFEVLLRLRDARSGELLMPTQFVPAAERFRLGTRIDRAVINQTLSWLEAHPEQAALAETCCINLSGEALIDEGFIGFVAERLRRSAFPPDRLCFEITETSAVRDLARARRFIGQMRALGCRFALDDFGTGFCSFSYLRELDVDYFKIDGSFVRDLHDSTLAEAVVRSITEIAHVLDKQTVAEHTETESHREALIALGVDFAQGYAFDRPRPIAEYFAERVRGAAA